MIKLEGLFGFKLKDKFEEEKFKIINKQDQIQDDWDDDALNEFIYEIENPLIPNEMFSEYWLRCSSKDKTITNIGAAFSQKNFPMYDPLELTRDLACYFVDTYSENYFIEWCYQDTKQENAQRKKRHMELKKSLSNLNYYNKKPAWQDEWGICKYSFLLYEKNSEYERNYNRIMGRTMGEKDPIHLLINLGGQEGEMLEIHVEVNLGSFSLPYFSDLEHYATHDEDFIPWDKIGNELQDETGL